MNIRIFVTMAVAAIVLLVSCNSAQHKKSEHEAPLHETHEHEASLHETHEHEASLHETHEHEAHEHEASLHEASEMPHANEILFSAQQAEAAGLIIETLKAGDFRSVIRTSGTIETSLGQEQTLVATTNGIVSFVKTSFSEGMDVQVGEPLVLISTNDLPEGNQAYRVKIAYEAAEKEYRRAESLVKNNIISVKEYEQTRLKYENAKTAYEAQSANMTDDGVLVKSPVGGYLKNRLVEQGQYVTVGQPIVVVLQNSRLQLRAEVSENNYKYLNSLVSANFRTSYDDALYCLDRLNGRLLSYGKSAGDNSFYIPVLFEFDRVSDIIPGSFVEIYLLSQLRNNVISVPISAITEEQGLYYVYLKIPNEDAYLKREVAIGQSNGERIEITRGVSEGESIVTKGVYQVKLAAMSGVIPEGHSHNH